MNLFSFFSSIVDIVEAIIALDFSIPSEIYLAISSLTNFVGYVMPLRLYSPIIYLILGYWLLLIMVKTFDACIGIAGKLFSLFG